MGCVKNGRPRTTVPSHLLGHRREERGPRGGRESRGPDPHTNRCGVYRGWRHPVGVANPSSVIFDGVETDTQGRTEIRESQVKVMNEPDVLISWS